MVVGFKRKSIALLEKILYKLLGTKQKKHIASLLSEKNRKRIKNIFKSAPKQQGILKVEQVKYKLRNLGFEDAALADMEALFDSNKDDSIKRFVAFEIALWHANKQTIEGAEKCLEWIVKAVKGERDQVNLRQIAILTAESMEMLGDKGKAKETLLAALEREQHPDLYLAMSNIEETLEDKLIWINKVHAFYESGTIDLRKEEDISISAYDRIETVNYTSNKKLDCSKAKVTVIVPVYNAEAVIHTSLISILKQTWSNLEVIVVDDCSTDSTVLAVKELQNRDKRLKLIQTEKNGGAYVARNLALKESTGDFITINDADDWSHPIKIEKQVLHLLANPAIMGNTSQQARATENLKFYRRGKPGLYIFSNMSSFMFRKEKVMNKIGFWDCVRFGGDSEYIKRIKKSFGERSIMELETGPLSYQRQTEASLTGNSSFGFPGFFMGARKEYLEGQTFFHNKGTSLYYSFPQGNRPFPIPEPMQPYREKDALREFDVIIVSDFRLDGGSTLSSVEEIKAQKSKGLRTGLIQLARYDYTAKKPINSKVRELIDGENVQMLVYGEIVHCKLLIVRYPPILQEYQKYLPTVRANNIRVIINQPPKSEYSESSTIRYDILKANERIKEYFGESPIWHPIGPLIRKALTKHHKEEIKSINLSDYDWSNIINTDQWIEEKEKKRKLSEPVIIGRHSRDHAVKWPKDKSVLLSIYPDSEKFEVHILGGGKTVENLLGKIPKNWTVYKFGEKSVKDFLSSIDVFVYFTHPSGVESFGRVIIEAMSMGVPVVLPKEYKDLFKDAAIYADIHEVQSVIENLTSDSERYNKQSIKGKNFVQSHFSYQLHYERVIKIIGE